MSTNHLLVWGDGHTEAVPDGIYGDEYRRAELFWDGLYAVWFKTTYAATKSARDPERDQHLTMIGTEHHRELLLTRKQLEDMHVNRAAIMPFAMDLAQALMLAERRLKS